MAQGALPSFVSAAERNRVSAAAPAGSAARARSVDLQRMGLADLAVAVCNVVGVRAGERIAAGEVSSRAGVITVLDAVGEAAVGRSPDPLLPQLAMTAATTTAATGM